MRTAVIIPLRLTSPNNYPELSRQTEVRARKILLNESARAFLLRVAVEIISQDVGRESGRTELSPGEFRKHTRLGFRRAKGTVEVSQRMMTR